MFCFRSANYEDLGQRNNAHTDELNLGILSCFASFLYSFFTFEHISDDEVVDDNLSTITLKKS